MTREEFRNIQSDKASLRKFGLTVGTVISLLALVILYKNQDETFKYLLFFGLFILLTGVFMPNILKPINYFWMFFAIVVGWIMTRIILTVLFIIVIAPIGLMARVAGKQFLQLEWNRSDKSYWNNREVLDLGNDHHEKQF